ncbi:carboxylate-amine ligase [Nocardioides dongxiaopingii]|uniref:carboxylate-amine ligase n=1 Tax=Nocardioides dongxiaopingii TaxID=2576036 RepID=UPI001FE83598|nr:glutamate--cysteine ligase [Nocardioides dongxiaopingii]
MTRGVRKVGVEEELWVVDPGSRRAVPRAPQVLRLADDDVERELFRHQVEIHSDPSTDLDDVGRDLRAARSGAGRAAEGAGLAVVASAVAVLASEVDVVSDDDRYRDMVARYGDVARSAGTCGMHVHVDVDSDEEGVAVIDRIAPWLPVVLAVSTNSPFADGGDTSYASWRSEQWSRWPSAGPTDPFGDVAGYRAASRALVRSGAARDDAMLYFDARLAASYPTVEIRVADVATDLDDSLLVASLVRALVHTAAAGALPVVPWRSELLRAARWRAARHGLAGDLLHPARPDAEPVGAADVLSDVVDAVRDALDLAGDTDRVAEGVARVLRGTGATRQRAALERTGDLDGVVDDLVARTRDSWKEP